MIFRKKVQLPLISWPLYVHDWSLVTLVRIHCCKPSVTSVKCALPIPVLVGIQEWSWRSLTISKCEVLWTLEGRDKHTPTNLCHLHDGVTVYFMNWNQTLLIISQNLTHLGSFTFCVLQMLTFIEVAYQRSLGAKQFIYVFLTLSVVIMIVDILYIYSTSKHRNVN